MSDDYLFDGTGEPDPDVVRLEQVLGTLRTKTTMPQMMVRLQADRGWYLGVRFLAPALAAAACVALMVGLAWNDAAPTPGPEAAADKVSWEVATIIGTPRIGANVVVGEGRIAIGQTLTTDEGSRAKMSVSDIGQVTVDGGSRVRLIETREGRHRLALDCGTLHAAIAAPPGQFVVDTPSATATDLGCVYSLHVDEDGSALLSVEVGWVAFEERGRESFVPMGASSRTDRVNGPGTPRYDDTDRPFRDAIDDIDNRQDAARRSAGLRLILAHARGRDAMTLWHLIPRVGDTERRAVVDALAARVPMPTDVSLDAVLRLARASLDRWWDTLGLNEASWWRKWKGAYPAAQAGPPPSCQETPTVRATPPPTNNAGPLGEGPWWINADRTIWMASATGPWHAGYNQKNMMVKPSGVRPTLLGTRIDAPAPPMGVRWVPQLDFEFQTMGLTFPSEGCWKLTATAADHELSFVTRVSAPR